MIFGPRAFLRHTTAGTQPNRVEPEVRAEIEAVLREGASLTQFIDETVADLRRLRELAIELALAGEAPTGLLRYGQ